MHTPADYIDLTAVARVKISWWIWEILDKYPALVLHYSGGVLLLLHATAAFSPHYYFLRT
jgi:hypothetical protein